MEDLAASSVRNEENLFKATEVLKILSHPVRLSILCSLIENPELSAGQICCFEETRASQSQVSQYLKILRDMGFVETRRQGQTIYYKIASPEVEAVIKTLHEQFCDKHKK